MVYNSWWHSKRLRLLQKMSPRERFEDSTVAVERAKNGIHREQSENNVEPNKSGKQQYKWEIVWRNVFAYILLHAGFLYGVYLMFTVSQWKTVLWAHVVGMVLMWGVTVGAHRLWTHRSFKAKLPLRILLAFLQAGCVQNDIQEWVRDHRVHHKYVDTDADPHNARRGFFFAHAGWLMVKKHKDLKEKGKAIDMSDIAADPVVRFQKKYYLPLIVLMAIIMPTFVPWYFWNEDLYVAFFAAVMYRWTAQLNGTWSVNSAAHIWGTKPYDKNLMPRENITVAFLSFGEGWHNYHHVFPWDYKAGEFSTFSFNSNAKFIELMAKIGWAYDLKSASDEMIQKRMARTGDLSFLNNPQQNPQDIVWGWDDKDLLKSEDIDLAKIQYQKQI